jgi:pimeloyl-ACP methyl ester carboxylesterase
VFDDPAKRQLVLDVSATISQVGRKAGYDNDIERFETIDDLELERITAPSLIVHGSADTDVEPDQGASAAARIPNAELLELETGTHFAFYTHPDADRAQARAVEYLAVA